MKNSFQFFPGIHPFYNFHFRMFKVVVEQNVDHNTSQKVASCLLIFLIRDAFHISVMRSMQKMFATHTPGNARKVFLILTLQTWYTNVFSKVELFFISRIFRFFRKRRIFRIFFWNQAIGYSSKFKWTWQYFGWNSI